MLTEHQNQILNQSLLILQKSKRLLIKGSAGVGKTYMVNELISIIGNGLKSDSIYCSAPTNKAVAVLKGKVNVPVKFVTTHSAMKLKRVINYNTGEISFKPDFDPEFPPLKGVKLFVIDECSMLNTELLEFIEKYAVLQGCTVIFIGDNKQLNPVNEEESPVFFKDYPEVELTEIVRQKGGNPIIDLSRNLSLINQHQEIRNDVGGYIYTANKDKIIETLAQVNGTDDLKYLAYTNQEVDSINNLVRKRIYGEPAKIEQGETLVFNAPLGDLYYTNEEITVNKLRIDSRIFKIATGNDVIEEAELKYYSINYSMMQKNEYNDKDEFIDTIKVIHEDSESDYKNICALLKARAKAKEISWVDYYNFVEMFADLKYNHAITVHKSQGSTYKQAIVNIKNININKNHKEKTRLLYTAVTRASELLILYNV